MKNKSYYYLLFLCLIFPLIPKSISNIFKLPIRSILVSIFIILVLYEIFIKKVKHRKINRYCIFIYLLFLIMCSLSFMVTSSKIITIYTLFKFLIYFLFFICLYMCIYTKEEYRYLITTFLISSLFIMIYGIINYLFNFNLNYNGIVKYKALGRVMSTMTNPIYYGIYLIFIFIITSYLLLESNNLKIKYILILNTILILSVINIFLTFTRSTYLLFLGSLFLISIINLKKIKKLLKNYIFIFLTIILMFILMPSIRLALKSAVIESIPTSILKKTDIKNSSMVKNQEEENKKIVYEDNTDYSIVTRHQFKTISKKVIKDHLIFGVGFGAYEQFFKDENNYKKYIVDRFGFPHDNFMHIFAETGILGFISFIIVIIMLMVIILHHYFINYDKLILYNFIMFIIVFLIMFYESFFYDSLIVPIYLGITSLSLNYVKEKKKCV